MFDSWFSHPILTIGGFNLTVIVNELHCTVIQFQFPSGVLPVL